MSAWIQKMEAQAKVFCRRKPPKHLIGPVELGSLFDRLEQQQERIKRLEEAGDRMAAAWSEEWLTQAEAESIIDGWHGAKEAKP